MSPPNGIWAHGSDDYRKELDRTLGRQLNELIDECLAEKDPARKQQLDEAIQTLAKTYSDKLKNIPYSNF